MMPNPFFLEAVMQEQRRDRERAIQRISLAYAAQAHRPPRRTALQWVGVQLERMGRKLQGAAPLPAMAHEERFVRVSKS